MSEFIKQCKENPLMFNCHGDYINNTTNVEWLFEVADDMYEALEKLACLGNGDYYGNSEGNEIARDALKNVDGKKREYLAKAEGESNG